MPAFMSGFQQGSALGERGLARRERGEESRLDRDYRERVFIGSEAERAMRMRKKSQEMAREALKISEFNDAFERFNAKTQTIDPLTGAPVAEQELAFEEEILPVAIKFSKDPASIVEQHLRNKALVSLSRLKLAQANDPESLENQLRIGRLAALWVGRDIAQGNLTQRQIGTDLRRTGLVQSAVGDEARLAGEGLAPTVPLMPDGTQALPQGAAVGQPLIQPIARPLTTANATQIQRDVVTTQLSLSKIDSTLAAIEAHPEAVGPSGVVGENLETIAGWLNPRREKSPIKDTRTKMRLAAHDIAAGLKLDAQISNYERAKLDEVADATGWMDSAPGTRDAYRAIQDALVAKALRQSNTLNQPISDELLARASADQIEQLVRNGLMREEQARRWFELHRRKP